MVSHSVSLNIRLHAHRWLQSHACTVHWTLFNTYLAPAPSEFVELRSSLQMPPATTLPLVSRSSYRKSSERMQPNKVFTLSECSHVMPHASRGARELRLGTIHWPENEAISISGASQSQRSRLHNSARTNATL